MKQIIFGLLMIAGTFLSGCAVGPLVVHETGRTVGDSNHEFVAGYGTASYALKYNYGITDNLDFGVQLEALSLGLRMKYAFINNQEKGWSLSSAAGIGTSIGGNHFYGDLMASYFTGKWEPYTAVRIVRVETDPLEFKDEDTGEVDFTIDAYKYTYGQYALGTKYWFTPNWQMSLEASSLFAVSDGVEFGSNVLVGLALGYRF